MKALKRAARIGAVAAVSFCLVGQRPAWADKEDADRIERQLNSQLNFAEEDIKAGNLNGGDQLDSVVRRLDQDDAKNNLLPEARKKIEARIADLRKQVDAGGKMEKSKEFERRIKSTLDFGEQQIESDPSRAREHFDDAKKLLAADDAKAALDAGQIKALTDRTAELNTKLAASNKKESLRRATPLMKKLEDRVADDPYKGVPAGQGYKVTEEMKVLETQLADALKILPADDADRKSYESRVAAVDKKLEAAGGSRDIAVNEDELIRKWNFSQKKSAGWEDEGTPGGAAAGGRRTRGGVSGGPNAVFAIPKVTKTVQAAQSAAAWLADPETVAARAKLKDSPKAAAAFAEAEKIRADALEKLDKIFAAWMDGAEKQPRPQGVTRMSIDSAQKMARAANDWFSDSKYKEANVTRALALDKKWKDELDTLKAEHAAALAKLTADATVAWPKIDAASGAKDGFNPGDADAAKGKTFRFKAVRNRTAWDFDGAFDLVILVNGQPVAGNYEPKIKQAFADAKKQIGDEVNEHIDWDVIAVVQGPGMVNAHYTTEIKASNMEVLGKVEGFRSIPCTLIKVIAVHAGPVAASAN